MNCATICKGSNILVKQAIASKSGPAEVVCTEPRTPMSDQRPEKEESFILQDFWPVLKIYQYLGLFPCKKVTHENGTVQLQPMKLWKAILAELIKILIVTLPILGNNLFISEIISGK